MKTSIILLLALLLSAKINAQTAPSFKNFRHQPSPASPQISQIQAFDTVMVVANIENERKPHRYTVFMSGGFNDFITEKKTDDKLSGGIGLSYDGFNLKGKIMFQINHFDNYNFADEVKPGSAILTPNTDFNSVVFKGIAFPFKSYDNFIISTTFSSSMSNAVYASEQMSAVPILFKLQTGFMLQPELGSNDVNFEIVFGYSNRSLGGDFPQNRLILREILGVEKNIFHGMETSFLANWNDISFFANLSYMPNKIPIAGLTGIQMNLGVAVSGSALKF